MSLSDERMDEIRARATWTCRERGADIDALLAHVDHLTAENARLREGIESLALEAEHAVDAKNPLSSLGRALLMWQPETLRTLLNPPTEGETDDPA